MTHAWQPNCEAAYVDERCVETGLELFELKHFENVWNETFWKWPGKCLKWKALALTIFEMDSRQRAVHFHMISLIICLKRMAFHLFLWWLWGRWCQCFWGSWWYWQFCWHWNSCSYPNCQLPDIYIALFTFVQDCRRNRMMMMMIIALFHSDRRLAAMSQLICRPPPWHHYTVK